MQSQSEKTPLVEELDVENPHDQNKCTPKHHSQQKLWRIPFISTVAVAAVLAIAGAVYAVQIAKQPSRPELTFFAVGDWGWSGLKGEQDVSLAMAAVARDKPPAFIISTGDNFYPNGLRHVNDARFNQSFLDVWNHPDISHANWYAVLGNHDYNDGSKMEDIANCTVRNLKDCKNECCLSPVWQMTQHLGARDSRWHCNNGTIVKTLAGGLLDMIMIDTTPFINHYWNQSWSWNAGGLQEQDPGAQKAAIVDALQSSRAPFKVVVGHHGVRSYGEHCAGLVHDCDDMHFLMPLLQKYGVAMYLNGHEHDLQHIKFPNETTHFVTSGSGGDSRRGEFDKVPDKQHAAYLSNDPGFIGMEVFHDRLRVSFYTSNSTRSGRSNWEHQFEVKRGAADGRVQAS